MSNGEDQILILAADDERQPGARQERGVLDAFGQHLRAVSTAVVRENLREFLRQVREIFGQDDEQVGPFIVDAVELSVQLTADGQVCLLAVGAKVAAQGAVKLVLRRPKP